MPYRAKEAIHSDVSPIGQTFNGKLLSESDPAGNFVVVGKGGIISDADAEKFGLTDSPLVEQVDADQVKREIEEKNVATHNRDGASVRIVPPIPNVPNAQQSAGDNDKPQPKAAAKAKK